MSTSHPSPTTGLRGVQAPSAGTQVPWFLTGNSWAVVSLALVVATSAVAVALDQPWAALLVMLAVPLVVWMIVWPDAPIPIIIFILYSNAAVVAVRFHGVPGLAAALLPAVLAVPLVRYIFLNRQPILVTPALPWVLLFTTIQMLSVLVSRHPVEALQNVQTLILEGLALYVIVVNVVRSHTTLRYAIWALLLAGAFMGGLSVFQQVTGTFNNHYGGFAQITGGDFTVAKGGIEQRQARLCGPVGEQNRYAQVMLMLVPLGFFHLLSESAVRWKVLAGVATALSAAGCALAFSRGAAIGFVLMLAVMVMMGQLRLRHLAFLTLGIILLLVAAPQYRTRLASVRSLADAALTGYAAEGQLDGAVRGRITVMLAAAKVAADHPLLGVGPGMFNYYSREYGNNGGMRALEGTREAHNLYLEIAAENGLIGLACFLVIAGISLRDLAQTRLICSTLDPQLSYWAAGFLLAIASYLATGLFLHFSYARYFWLVLALGDATSRLRGQASAGWTAPRASPAANLYQHSAVV